MNKICTSIKQSKKLIELGINEDTSDMVYLKSYFEDEGEYNLLVGSYQEGYAEKDDGTLVPIFDEHIPAWSLSALLELIPHDGMHGIELNNYNDGKTIWTALFSHKSEFYTIIRPKDTAVDAVFEIVVWLKKNKKL